MKQDLTVIKQIADKINIFCKIGKKSLFTLALDKRSQT